MLSSIPVEIEYTQNNSHSNGGRQSHRRPLILLSGRTRTIPHNSVYSYVINVLQNYTGLNIPLGQ